MSAVVSLPALGEVIGEGRFELLRQLGDGGMSTVFVAADRFLGREVALKLLTPRYVGRPEREQRLVNEAEYLRRVQGHPNIVEIIDSGRLRDRDGWPWLATEILRGEVLAWLFMHGRIELPRVVSIARQVAVALEACHAAGIVHRDITPNNVFILADQQTAKIFDFSHAADTRAPRVAVGAPERLTGVFDTPGTLGYMGPEQVLNAPPDASMDAFAFGVLLFKLVTGRSPYRQFTDRDDFIKAQREGTLEPPRLHAWAYDAPEDLAELLHDCTQHEGAKRPSMAEVVARLDAVELPSVQDDDATSFYRRPAAAARREAPKQEDVASRDITAEDSTVGVDMPTTAFVPSHESDELTEPVEVPTLIRPRPGRTAPPLEGDWVVANQQQQLMRPVAAAGAIQLPVTRSSEAPASAASPELDPQPQLAFARPPEHRLLSAVAEQQVVAKQPAVAERAVAAEVLPPKSTVDGIPPTADAELTEAPVSTKRLIPIIMGCGLVCVLLVIGWWGWSGQTGQDTEHSAPVNDTQEAGGLPSEPEVTPPSDSETGYAFEPVPEVEPTEGSDSIPEIAPVEPKPRPQPKPKPKPKQNPPDHPVKADCEGVEQKARAAADKADWRQVASSTARKECWSSAKERASLRVRAMFELGNWKECAALGDKAEPSVQKYVEQCQSLTQQGPP